MAAITWSESMSVKINSIDNQHKKLFEIINEWIVIGTETGNRKGKIVAQKDWIISIAKQAKDNNIPVFMKDTLLNIVGKENMLQELPFK